MRALALLSGAALSAAVLTACGSDSSEPPVQPETSSTPTATPTAVSEAPTPSPESGGKDGFREFARQIDEALADGDTLFFIDRGVETETVCAGDEQLGPCVDQPAGTVLRGIPGAVGQSDAFTLFTPGDYAAMLEDWFTGARPDLSDEYGGGAVTLYALASRPAGAEENHLAIVTAIITSGPDAFRQGRILSFLFLDGTWRLTNEVLASVPQTAADWLSGECSEICDHWERWEGIP